MSHDSDRNTICDRCGANGGVLPSFEPDGWLFLESYTSRLPNGIHLCPDCHSAFTAWIHGLARSAIARLSPSELGGTDG